MSTETFIAVYLLVFLFVFCISVIAAGISNLRSKKDTNTIEKAINITGYQPSGGSSIMKPTPPPTRISKYWP